MLVVRNPANGDLVGEHPETDPSSLAELASRARVASRAWRRRPLEERLAVVREFRARLEAELEPLAGLLCDEVGKPINQARGELRGTLGRLDWFLAKSPAALAPVDLGGEGTREEIRREPLGVIANISAWNYPWFVGSNVYVPALIAGNAVLYKPSELCAGSGLAVARLWQEAGLPADLFTTLVGAGELGSALLNAPIDAVFFTGSVATGRKINEAAARRLLKVQLELGGKDPAYVCDDVDPAKAAAAVAEGAFYNAGQSCCALERVYVQRKIAEPFLAALVKEVEAFKIGDPRDEETFIGPMTRDDGRRLVKAQIDAAVAEGARLLCGGAALEGEGQFFAPTVLADCTNAMAVFREESFGPVIGVAVVGDDVEAIRLMDDTSFGLTAAVFSSSEERAKAILEELETGSAYWNCCDRVSPALPWSGCRESGIGLTLSIEGIQTMTRPRAWHLRP